MASSGTTTTPVGPGTGGTCTSTVTIVLTLSGSAVQSSTQFPLIQNANSTPTYAIVTLNAGNNTVTLPTAPGLSGGLIMTPPAGNIQTLTLKGVNGDTGITLHPTASQFLAFPAAPQATFVLNAGGTITGMVFQYI